MTLSATSNSCASRLPEPSAHAWASVEGKTEKLRSEAAGISWGRTRVHAEKALEGLHSPRPEVVEQLLQVLPALPLTRPALTVARRQRQAQDPPPPRRLAIAIGGRERKMQLLPECLLGLTLRVRRVLR